MTQRLLDGLVAELDALFKLGFWVCWTAVAVGVPLGVLYGLIRFVKWAWLS